MNRLSEDDAGCVVSILVLGASVALVLVAFAFGQWLCGCLR